jgi:hypothetical protein
MAHDPWWWQPLPAGEQIEHDELVDRLVMALPPRRLAQQLPAFWPFASEVATGCYAAYRAQRAINRSARSRARLAGTGSPPMDDRLDARHPLATAERLQRCLKSVRSAGRNGTGVSGEYEGADGTRSMLRTSCPRSS